MFWLRSRHFSLLICAFLGALSAVPSRAESRKILIVKSKALPFFDQAAQGFKKCLATKGVAASFDELVLQDDPAVAEAALYAAKADKADLLLTIGAPASRLAREKFPAVPSIFCMVIDPIANGLEKGGVSMDPRPEDYVAYIHKNFPAFKRVGILYNPQKVKIQSIAQFKAADATLVLQQVTDISRLDDGLQQLKKKADCLLMVVDPSIYSPQTIGHILLEALQMNLPFIAISPSFVKAGALTGLYADADDNGCQAAELAAKVLSGEKPAALPLLPPHKLGSTVNLIVAQRLGVAVSANTRSAAEQVIE